MKGTGILIGLFLLAVLTVQGQQLPVDNQYQINPFSLNPAFAGHNANAEIFLGYRKAYGGFEGAPVLQTINGNSRINSQMGIGGTITNDQVGAFRDFSAEVAWSYRLKLDDAQDLAFGVNAGFMEVSIDRSLVSESDLQDQVVMANAGQSFTGLNAGAGIRYRFNDLQVGVAALRLLENEFSNDAGDPAFTTKRHFRAHASYRIRAGKTIAVVPMGVVRTTLESPLYYEGAVQIRYDNHFWLAANYRKTGAIGISAGAKVYQRFVFQYGYEFGSDGVLAQANGTHDLMLGFVLGKQRNTPSSIFYQGGRKTKGGSKKLYYRWLDR